MTRKAHEPTEKDRKQVTMMSGIGLTHDQISKVMQISDETLRKYYRDELETGEAKTTALVAQNLFNIATGSGQGAVTAAIFWMKTRAGWREVSRSEVSGPDGGAVKVESSSTIDIKSLGADQREVLKQILLSAQDGQK
mgnify:CR=1 FL=1